MNPTGLRLEEKKSADEVRSVHSYKSTHSSRSSVLERAREYNRRIEEQEQIRRRSKSLERSSSSTAAGSTASSSVLSSTQRSRSAGRAAPQAATTATTSTLHERAMFSVRRDTAREQRPASATPLNQPRSSNAAAAATTTTTAQRRAASASPAPQHRRYHHTVEQAGHNNNNNNLSASPPTTGTTTTTTTHRRDVAPNNNNNNNHRINDNAPSIKSRSTFQPQQQPQQQQQHTNNKQYNHDNTTENQPPQEAAAAVVTPELLVDALSGHEDGLLAIAEKLMEHYDAGYDVMGEAIIDAFADVQKLFQHVVEAAHMEGAAFEASRREGELEELRKQVGESVSLQQQLQLQQQGMTTSSPSHNNNNNNSPSSAGPTRHDEFIDQDVKDILTEAIRKGTTLRDNNRHVECYELFEQACQSASALLPVDSDHRGRLQLSIARAESMSPDRACAILRYAMDDVLRSGMRAIRTPLPDPSQRADVVLSRPTAAGRGGVGATSKFVQAGVVQSADEALASLMEEMKEILSAPVYNDTPLQSVAKRFWAALQESHKAQQKNEERLEQNLAKLKGEFLLARAEWEEKLTQANDSMERYKEKYEKLKDSMKSDGYMDHARSLASRLNESYHHEEGDGSTMFGSVKSHASKANSVASLGSGLAQHARTIVTSMNNFNCSSMNNRNAPVVDNELSELHERGRTPSKAKTSQATTTAASTSRSRSRSAARSHTSRTFQESYSRSPQRVDV